MQVSESGLEIQGYSRALVTETGVNPKGHLAQELKVLFHSLFLMTCHDRLNVTQLTSAEHLSRRILQLLEAVAVDAKQPNFEQLEGYLLHMAEPGTTSRAGKFAAHIASRQQQHGQILKQLRLAKEEEESKRKKNDKEKDKDKKDKKGKGDAKGDGRGE